MVKQKIRICQIYFQEVLIRINPQMVSKCQKYNQFKLQSTMLKFRLITITLLLLVIPISSLYCSSTCIDYTGACFDETPSGCWVCANHIFNFNSDLSSSTRCTPLSQSTVLANQLSNSAMSLYGYSSNSLTPVTCTNYTFSGKYTANSYLSKSFTNIPLNHYALVVRFSVGYLGTWSASDGLRLNLQDSIQSINYDYFYHCDVIQNICGETYTTTDCVRIRQYTMIHNTSSLILNFTSLTSVTDPSIQWWGIKELIISAKLCHSYCSTCYGPNNSNCLSCATSYYLQGNVCLQTCDNSLYTLPAKNLCVSVCPEGYYSFINSTNQEKSCLKCQSGCVLCSGPDICQAWTDTSAYVPNLWKDKMQFWILLILVLAALLFFVIFKIIKKTMPVNSQLSQKLNKSDQKPKFDEKENSEQIKSTKSDREFVKKTSLDRNYTVGNSLKSEAKLGNDSLVESIVHTDYKGQSSLWFNELVQVQPNEVKVARGRRRRRAPKEEEIKEQGDIQIASKNQNL